MACNYDGDLPEFVDNNGVIINIRDKCDYRIVRKVIRALKDTELSEMERAKCALIIFYENYNDIKDVEDAIKQMFSIIECENEYRNTTNNYNQQEEQKPPIMDWDYDWDIIAPEINKVLGYEIRTPQKYTHWQTLIGAYKCIGEGLFNTIVSIRNKKQKGKKLEQWENEFYRENRRLIDLPQNLTEEEKEWLDSDW